MPCISEIERLRVAHDDLNEVPIADFTGALILGPDAGGADTPDDGTGLNTLRTQAGIDN